MRIEDDYLSKDGGSLFQQAAPPATISVAYQKHNNSLQRQVMKFVTQ
jgi:hypothetical protein